MENMSRDQLIERRDRQRRQVADRVTMAASLEPGTALATAANLLEIQFRLEDALPVVLEAAVECGLNMAPGTPFERA